VRVVAGAPVIGRDAPLRLDEILALEAIEGGVKRALAELQHALGPLLDPLGNAPTMHRLELQRLEDEHVQRSLQDGILLPGLFTHASAPFD
jgi:hypothetical protein